MVSLILPTYNEKANLPSLVPAIFAAWRTHGIDGEVIVVDDDSPDGTSAVAGELAKQYNVQVVVRKGARGLATAVLVGFAHARYDILGVMDADWSHPPADLPRLLKPILEGDADLVIGSRYLSGGRIQKWSRARRWQSKAARRLDRPLVNVTDAMSGFFALKREVLEGRVFRPKGYKIALEILVKGRYQNVVEIPFTFRDRAAGESKFSWTERLNVLRHLFRLYLYRIRTLM